MKPILSLLLVLSPSAWGAPASALVQGESPLVKVAEYQMREARFGAAAVIHGDHLYVSGGSNEGNWVLDSMERLDLRTGVSQPFGRLQRGRLWHRAIVVGQTMYVLGGATMDSGEGGQRIQGPDDSVELIDLPTGRVSRGPTMPDRRRSFACWQFDGKLHVIGGFVRSGSKSGWSNSTLLFDLSTKLWSRGASLLTAREAEAAVVDDSLVVVAGGYSGVGALDQVEFFDPRKGHWQALPPLCRETSAHAVALLGHELFLFGHYDDVAQCLVYDLRTRQSKAITAPFAGARHSAAVVHRDRIYLVGGRTAESSEGFARVQVFARRTP